MTEVTDICHDIVRYGRHYIIGNEQQFLCTILCLLTAFSNRYSEFVPAFIIGELSGGKTHLQRTAHKLIDEQFVHSMTSASDKAPIYSTSLRTNMKLKIIKFGEYNKLSKPILEFLKSLSGDDDIFVYEVTSMGNTEKITHRKYVYTVTYAQVDIDPELQSRVFVIPIMENYSINKAVALVKLGAKKVEYMGQEYDMTHDQELENSIMEAIASMSELDVDVTIPYTYALIDMVNHSRAVSKRHANLISAMVKASARLNWMARETNEDGDIIASAQDVANVLCLFDLLRATFMSIDIIETTIYHRLCGHPDQTEEMLIEYLQTVGLAELTKSELTRRLNKMYNENYILRTSSSNGFIYSSNKRKRILDLEVNWDDIYKHDTKPIIDVISGQVFDNIKSFGKHLEAEHTIKESKMTNGREIGEEEQILRDTIVNWVMEPDNRKSRSAIANTIPNEPHIDALDIDVNYYVVVSVLNELMEEGILEYENDEYRIVM